MTTAGATASRRARRLAAYAGILALAAVALLVVLPIGSRLTAAPQGPADLAVHGGAEACLGTRVSLAQSGVYVSFTTGGNGHDATSSAVADGQVRRDDGTATLHGTCVSSSVRGGQPFTWDLQIVRHPAAGAAAVTGAVVVGGDRLPAQLDATAHATAGTATVLTGDDLVARTFLALALILVAARGAGWFFGRLRQPRVVGEIVAGIVLGPSLLGHVAPGVDDYLFRTEVTDVLRVVAQLGLILFMFIVGLELEHRLVRGAGHVAVLISHTSIVVPFVCGLAVSLVLYPMLGGGDFTGFALFMGAAMAITAFPVLARILTDTGLHRTRLGAVAITCAAVDDVTAWCVLAVDVAVVRATGGGQAARTILLSLAFVACMVAVVRPVLDRLVRERDVHLTPTILAAVLVFLLLSSWIANAIGIHVIFGAFLAGTVMPRSHLFAKEIIHRLEDLTVLLLLPIFFVIVGLSTRIDLLDRGALWLVTALVVLLAIAGKFGATLLAGRATGEEWRFAAGLGLLMNTRGLTEIVILSVGRTLGVISPVLFTVMVLMALATTFMATPLLLWLFPDGHPERATARGQERAHVEAHQERAPERT